MERATTSLPLVETKNLKKYFKVGSGLLHAVDDISLQIPQGRTLGVVGESGCGKSTLGRVMLRLTEPTDGEVLFNGENIVNYSKAKMQKMRKDMQIIFQDPYSSIDPRKTVADSIAEPLVLHKVFSSKPDLYKRISYLMDKVGLATRLANAYPHELDGGRRQRIGVARALALGPKFIVCDEPVSALDVSIQAQILNLLMDLQEEMGLTYMFVSHDLSVVKHISTEIMVMYLGKCVEHAPTEELFANPQHPYTKALLSAIPVPDIAMRSREPALLRGEVTSPINPSVGCRFAARCEHCVESCSLAQELIETRPGHRVACHMASKA